MSKSCHVPRRSDRLIRHSFGAALKILATCQLGLIFSANLAPTAAMQAVWSRARSFSWPCLPSATPSVPYIRPSVLLVLFGYGTLLVWCDQGTISATQVQGSDPNADYADGIPGLIPDLNLSLSQYAWLGPCFTIGLIVGSFIFAALSISFNELRLQAYGILVWAAGSVLAGFAPNFGVMVLARLIGGSGAASVMTLTFPFIDDVAPPKHRTLWFGVLGMCQPVGIAVGYIGIGEVASASTWRTAFWVQAALGAPFVLAALLLPPVQLKTHQRTAVGMQPPAPPSLIVVAGPRAAAEVDDMSKTWNGLYDSEEIRRLPARAAADVKEGGAPDSLESSSAVREAGTAVISEDASLHNRSITVQPPGTAGGPSPVEPATATSPVGLQQGGQQVEGVPQEVLPSMKGGGEGSCSTPDPSTSGAPEMGCKDKESPSSGSGSKLEMWLLSRWSSIVLVVSHASWNYNNLGYIPIEFVLQMYSYWGPLVAVQLYPQLSSSTSDLAVGATALVGGFLGSLGGGLLLDRFGSSIKNGFMFSAVFTMVATIFYTISMAISSLPLAAFLVLTGLGTAFAAAVNPINYALSMWSVLPASRPMSQALLTLSQRLVSDIPAPPVVGGIQGRLDNWRITANIAICYLVVGAAFYAVGWVNAGSRPDYRVLYEEIEARDIAEAEAREEADKAAAVAAGTRQGLMEQLVGEA